jgi:hypothetical protein
VTVADSNSLDVTHGFTLEAWVKPSSITNEAVVIAKNSSLYALFSSIDGYCGTNSVMGGFDAGGFQRACVDAPLTVDTWVHLALTYDRTLIRLYKDGTLVTSTSATAFVATNTSTLQIGGSVFSEFFTGLIDEIRIYNYARSASQVVTDRDTPINSIPSTPFLTIGAGSSALKLGAGAAAFKMQGATQ